MAFTSGHAGERAYTGERTINLTKISAFAEIVSSIAIVITLVYLTVETRQNTNALIASSRQAMLDSDMAWLSDALEYPGLVERADAEDLTETEVARLEIMWVRYLRIREFSWFQYRSGLLDEPTWQSFMRPTAGIFSSERAKNYLERGGYNGDPAFLQYLDQWLRDHRPQR